MGSSAAVPVEVQKRNSAVNPCSAFVALEQSNCVARGLLTLHLIGRMSKEHITALIDKAQEDEEVQKQSLNISHIHFGTHNTFDGEQSSLWVDNVKHFLREGFWCTLEMRPTHLSLIVKTGLCRQSRFIPLISMPAPHIVELGSNAVFQLTDHAGTSWSMSVGIFLQQKGVLHTPQATRIVIE